MITDCTDCKVVIYVDMFGNNFLAFVAELYVKINLNLEPVA